MSEPKEHEVVAHYGVTLNENLLNNGDDIESNKSFLIKKFFEDSRELSTNRELVTQVKRPIPVPRKNKNKISEKVVNRCYSNSVSSHKTYVIEEDKVRAENIEPVGILIQNSNSSSTSNSSINNGTYIKNASIESGTTENINVTHLEKHSDSKVSTIESKICSNQYIERKVDDGNGTKTNCKYNTIMEIIIHKTDALQLDSCVTQPLVKVHVVDINTGKYYLKSSKSRSVVFYYENEEQDYILPVMTSSCNLQEKRTFSPEWEESILLNEDFSYLTNENVIIFFEVLDYAPLISKKFKNIQKYCYKGWRVITFAFLKLLGNCNSNLNKKLKLQLYYPKEIKRRDPTKCDLWYIWKANRLKKYSAALYITIKEVIPPKKVTETFRSKTPLQKESISNQKNYKQKSRNLNNNVKKEVISKVGSKSSIEMFYLPNKPLVELDTYDNGCLILKFSNNGLYLACAVRIKDVFNIIVYTVGSFEEMYSLNEHRGLIYSICWSLDDSLLISASADNTVEIWNFSTHSFLQILPHPNYVYSSYINDESTMIVTGCYDATLRIWLYDRQEKKYDLHQEIENHGGYITSVCFNKKSTNLYSSDSTGHIIEWSRLNNPDWQYERDISTSDLRQTVINQILLFPNERKMLVHSRDSILRIISIKRACVLHWLKGALNCRIQTFCSITSCGSYVTSGSENGLVVLWDSKTGKDVFTYEPFLNHLNLNIVHCVQFHPKDNIIAFSHYGSTSPVLMYHCNRTEGEEKSSHIPRHDSNRKSISNEKSTQQEKMSFYNVLQKMDKLLI